MTNDTNFYSSDRLQVIQDERDRIITLSDFNLQLPQVGIFDEPTRCYTVNKEWAKIITGAVSLLLEIACWPGADNEDYPGIRQIQEYLIGGNCMDCDGVEACLATSTIISQIQNAILLLQNKDIDLQNQINVNKNDINAHQALINTLTNYVADHEARITLVETDIADVQLSILGINAINIQQNERLDILEYIVANLPKSSGSGTDIRITRYGSVCLTTETTTGITWLISGNSIQTHEFIFDNAFLVIEFRAKSAGSGGGEFRPYVEAQPKSLAYTQVGVTESSLQVQDLYTGLSGKTLDIGLEYHSSGSSAQILANQTIQIFVFEWQGLVSNIVTFDAGSLPYTLPAINDGVLSTGGNPDNCLLQQNIVGGDELVVDIDLGVIKTINSIPLQIFSSDFSNTRFRLEVNGTPVGAQYGFSGETNNTWVQTGYLAALFPLQAQTLRIFVYPYALGPTIADLRVDNIEINWQ